MDTYDTRKKAILVVSFGTTHMESCRNTIRAIEDRIAEAYPSCRVYRAWTSSFIIKKLKRRDGLHIDTVEEAFERMAKDGIREVAVVPTHMIAGAEMDKLLNAVQSIRKEARRSNETGEDAGLRRIELCGPLLDSEEDIERLAGVILSEYYGEQNEKDPAALILMGHGSAASPEANRVYQDLEEKFHTMGCDNVFVGTVEGDPSIDNVIEKFINGLKINKPEQDADVLLAPLMIVAGDHALNDMASDDPESWKCRIAAALIGKNDIMPGCTLSLNIVSVLRGLGSYPKVREMFVDKLPADFVQDDD